MQIGLIIGVLEQSFNQAWAPWLFERLSRKNPDDKQLIARITRWYNVGIITLALAIAAIAPWFLRFFVGRDFAGAGQFVLWLALGNAFSGMYKMVVNQIFYANKTHLLAWVTFVTGVANVGLTYALIRINGAVGAAQGTALALLLSYLMTAQLSRRVSRAWE
jgi:O-antigen/teichoic acid export membrane protein